jgi:LuxR family maltose regulon positive regulatory protein
MKYALLHTKLNRPSVTPDIVPRDRLIKRLEQGRKRPLTLISAAAGYGKSTLSSRWVAGCDYPNAWVSLEESDSDLHMFLSYLLATVA